MFLPEFDREYLQEKSYIFREVTNGAQKGLIIQNWPLPLEKFNCQVSNLLILLPPGYPDAPPDMFYFEPSVLLMPYNRHPRAADTYQPFEGKNWQRWSRHFPAAEWRTGIDGIHTFLKKIEEAINSAA